MSLHRFAALAALLLVAGPAGLADPTAAHARERSCGNVQLADGHHVEARVEGTSCAAGLRMLSWYATTTSPCTGSGCFRMHRGWNCASATAASRPRLFSCSRGSRTYAVAYEMRGRVTL